MAFLKSKKTAVAVFIVLVLFSVLFGSHRSLNALRNDAMDVYINGDDTGLSILANMNSIQEYTATLLKTAATHYTSDDDAYAALTAAYGQLAETADAPDAAKHRQALTTLTTACTSLQADYTGRSDIPQEAAKAMTRSINDITSMKDQIRHSGYNACAAEFNAVLETFPAGLLGSLTGVKALPLF